VNARAIAAVKPTQLAPLRKRLPLHLSCQYTRGGGRADKNDRRSALVREPFTGTAFLTYEI
jgi:hypothetical protein